MEGDSAGPHKHLQAQREQFHPPATNTPSRDGYALQSGSKDRPHAPLSSAGGCFCHPERGRVLSPLFSAREGIPVPGGRLRPGRAILHALTSSSRHNADTSTLPQHFHPPATFSPSGADSGTAGFEDPVQQKARGRGGAAGVREQVSVNQSGKRKGRRDGGEAKGGQQSDRGRRSGKRVKEGGEGDETGTRVGKRERDEDEGGRRGSGVAANQPRAPTRLRDTVRYPDGENFPNFTQF